MLKDIRVSYNFRQIERAPCIGSAIFVAESLLNRVIRSVEDLDHSTIL
jgi:hypothetical protein